MGALHFTLKGGGSTNRVFGKPCFCPLPKRGHFDENGENDEFAFYPLKTRVWLLRFPKTMKMTKMAGVTQEKAWFRKGRVCSSLIKGGGKEHLRVQPADHSPLGMSTQPPLSCILVEGALYSAQRREAALTLSVLFWSAPCCFRFELRCPNR